MIREAEKEEWGRMGSGKGGGRWDRIEDLGKIGVWRMGRGWGGGGPKLRTS
jgi:hypothetical protein